MIYCCGILVRDGLVMIAGRALRREPYNAHAGACRQPSPLNQSFVDDCEIAMPVDRTFSPNESSLKVGSGEKAIGIRTPPDGGGALVVIFRDRKWS
jgi:hypothetical protein